MFCMPKKLISVLQTALHTDLPSYGEYNIGTPWAIPKTLVKYGSPYQSGCHIRWICIKYPKRPNFGKDQDFLTKCLGN